MFTNGRVLMNLTKHSESNDLIHKSEKLFAM